MSNKSCGDCKHCIKLIPVQDGDRPPLWICNWICDFDDDDGGSYNVTPPYDEACEQWEEDS
jgi:hypothetical protein